MASATPIFDVNNQFDGSFGMFTDITEHKIAEERIKKLSEEQKNINLELISKNIELKRARNATLNIIEDLSQEIEEKHQVQQRVIQLASIVEYSDDAIIGKNLDGIIVSWNRGAEKIYGYSENEVLGKPISILIPQHNINELEQILNQIKENKHIEHYETLRCRKDKTIINVSLTISPVKDSSGNIIGASSIARDITERKLAETKLRESETRFRTLVENAADAFFLHDMVDTTIVDVNHQACEYLGYSREELIGMTAYDLDAQIDQSFIDKMQTRQIAGETIEFETLHHRKDGTVFPVEVRARMLEEDGHNYSVTLVHDITERKRAQEELAIREMKFRTLAENSPDIIARYDVNCKRIYVNPNMEKYLGRKASEILGKTPTEEILIKDAEKYKEKLLEVLQTGEETQLDIVLPDTGEGLRYHNIRFVAEYNLNKSIEGVLAIGRDVTERILAQKEIQKINIELEQRVKSRTAQLEVANKELESFAYSVSHDLRAPLRSIDGFSQVLLENYNEKLDSDGKDYLDRVCKSAQRMGQLIDDLLQLSRISRDNMNIDTINISKITQNIIEELKEVSPERKVQFKIQNNIIAKGDKRLIHIAMENLLGNAWKFTSKLKNASIEFGMVEKDNNTVYFVKDNGAGFNMKYNDKLFGAFQRLHSIADFPGTGIGLATVQRIIHRHGGRIWAEGKIEAGAIFYFTLPV